jgi:hypothetical protein
MRISEWGKKIRKEELGRKNEEVRFVNQESRKAGNCEQRIAELQAMLLTPFAPLTRDLPIARSPHHATIRQSGSDQSTRRRPRGLCCRLRKCQTSEFDGMAKKGEGEIRNEQPAFATLGP